jgi:hypothetical protein
VRIRIVQAIVVAAALMLPALAQAGGQDGQGQDALDQQGQQGGESGGSHYGAPGPIAGAGLPLFAVGYGVYWLIKRRRRADI